MRYLTPCMHDLFLGMDTTYSRIQILEGLWLQAVDVLIPYPYYHLFYVKIKLIVFRILLSLKYYF